MRIADRNKAHEFLRMWEKNHDDYELRALVKAQWDKGKKADYSIFGHFNHFFRKHVQDTCFYFE